MTTTTDTTAARIAAIEASTAGWGGASTLIEKTDLDWLIAELRAARELIDWFADDDNWYVGDYSRGSDIEVFAEERIAAYLNRGAE